MTEGWKPLFEGDVEGRPVKLERYDPSGELKVTTTQLKTVTTKGYVEGSSKVFPGIVGKGQQIKIEANNPDELERDLVSDADFSIKGAKETARHARNPRG